LPDLKPKSKMPNRKWTTAVICSLKPEFMRQTIDHSLKLRLNEGIVRDREAKVEICAEYLELLENAPQIASKFTLHHAHANISNSQKRKDTRALEDEGVSGD